MEPANRSLKRDAAKERRAPYSFPLSSLSIRNPQLLDMAPDIDLCKPQHGFLIGGI
jgi:hypothetical protein